MARFKGLKLKRKQWAGLILLALPILLYVVITERLSWRPHVLCRGIVGTEVKFINNDSELLIVGSDEVGKSMVQVRDAANGVLKKELPISTTISSPPAMSSDGVEVALPNMKGDIAIYNIASHKIVSQLAHQSTTAEPVTIIFSPDHKTLLVVYTMHDEKATFAESIQVRLWDIKTQKLCARLLDWIIEYNDTDDSDVTSETTWTFSPDNSYIVALIHGILYTWNTKDGKLWWRCAGIFSDGKQKLAFASNSKILVGVDKQVLKVWDMTTRSIKQILQLPVSYPAQMRDINFRVSFSPDGRLIVVFDKDSLSLTVADLRTGHVLYKKGGDNSYFYCRDFTLSPDGKTLAVTTQDRVELYDLMTGVGERKLLLANTVEAQDSVNHVVALAFTSDSNNLAISTGTHSDANPISLWRIH